MIEYFYSDPKVLQHYRTGPLGPHLDRFAQLLKQTGYTWLSGQDKLRVVVQLNQWLIAKQYRLSQLDDRLVRAFQADQRKRRSSHHGEKGTLALLLRMLREVDLIAALPAKKARGPVDLLVQGYAQFLSQERCLSSTTLAHRLPMARQCLPWPVGVLPIYPCSWNRNRSSKCSAVATVVPCADDGITPSCSCCPGWACGRTRCAA